MTKRFIDSFDQNLDVSIHRLSKHRYCCEIIKTWGDDDYGGGNRIEAFGESENDALWNCMLKAYRHTKEQLRHAPELREQGVKKYG